MSVWNVFDQDAFSLQSLTAAINKAAFTPTMISGLNVFEEQGVPNLTALVEELEEKVALVGVKPRNAPGDVVIADKRKVHNISIPHLPEHATIMADAVQGVREFGSEGDSQTVESERNKRLAKMRRQIDYTVENHRLISLQGNYVDVNGDTQSAYTLLGGSRDSVDFVLGTSSTKIREKALDVIGHVEDGLGGTSYTEIHALCSTDFWKKLITHPKVEETYLNTAMAAALRNGLTGVLEFGDIIWHRYRGTSAVGVASGKAYAFPVGVSDMYLTRFAPANYNETVNTIGLPYYAKARELPFGKGIEIEAQSNPLNLCIRPTALVEITTSN